MKDDFVEVRGYKSMGERYINESEFRYCIQTLIGMIENGSSKKEALDYLNSLIKEPTGFSQKEPGKKEADNHSDYERTKVLNQIKRVLDDYGFENEIRYDRVDGPYINLGDVRRSRNRAQFWYQESSRKVHFWAGNEMGFWYNQSVDSKYRVPWKANSDKETKLSFPDVSAAIEYIKEVAEKYGRL